MIKTTQKQSFKTHFIKHLSRFKNHVQSNQTLHYLLFGAGLAVLFLAPYYDSIPGSSTTNSQLARMMYFTVAALGLNLLLGFGGLISLAVAGFIGLGVILPAFFMVTYEWTFEFSVLITLIIAIVIGIIVGLFSLKVDGIYLAIGTLFVGSIMTNIFTRVLPIESSNIRIGAINFLGRYELRASASYFQLRTGIAQYDRYYLGLILIGLLVLAMIVTNNIIKSRTGRALMAMSRSSSAAQAMGVHIAKYRIMAFTISIVFATVSGIMYLIWEQDAIKYGWGLDLTLFILAVVMVGGIKSIFGMFIGAFVIFALPQLYIQEYLNRFSAYLLERHEIVWSPQGFTTIFAGLLIILVILYYPNGLVYIWYDIKKLTRKIKPKLIQLIKKVGGKRG